MYKVTAYSYWIIPQEHFVETRKEAEELAKELKSFQYSVDIEYIDEGEV